MRRKLAEKVLKAMVLPSRHRMPMEMVEAVLVTELGIEPDKLDMYDQELIDRMLLYRGVKSALTNGGTYNG